MKTATKLYRYRAFNPVNLKSEIVEGNIWFSTLNDFNDPNEGRVKNSFTIRKETIELFLIEMRDTLLVNPSYDAKLFASIKKDMSNDSAYKEFIKNRADKFIEIFETKNISENEVKYLQFRIMELVTSMDKFDIRKTASYLYDLIRYNKTTFIDTMFHRFINFVRNNTVVACFSKRWFCPYMFALYADNHQGVCIEYCFEKPINYLMRKVEYVEGLPTVEDEDVDRGSDGLINKYIYNKTNIWANECEIRIATWPNSKGLKPIKNISGSISKICFGINMEEKNKKEISNWVNDSVFQNIQLLDCIVEDNDWKFAVQTWS